MDFSEQNDKERAFFKKDFSVVGDLISRIRQSLSDGSSVYLRGLALDGIIDFKQKQTFVFITLFQSGLKPLRYGSCRSTLISTINRDIVKIRQSRQFKKFDIDDINKCRIMLEYVTEQVPVDIEKLNTKTFSPSRFEPGITGLRITFRKINLTYTYMPTDAWILSQMSLNQMFKTFVEKFSRPQQIKQNNIQLTEEDISAYIIKSRTFISFEDSVIPLYRGNVLWEYSPEAIKEQALAGANWLIKYMTDEGKFLYYYDCKDDSLKNHEHPKNPSYYNDLRHCGSVITLIRAYQLTKDEKYLFCAKKAIQFVTTITHEHKDKNGQSAAYVFLNQKAKLGGTGMALIAMMKYRCENNDRSFDDYIKNYVRHIVSRISQTGEMLGYYIHPKVQNGLPLTDMTDEERRDTFSFYYPGEALLGLALFVNYFEGEEELKQRVVEKSKFALDWLVDARPGIYADQFKTLPSDAWLMQAVEEWASYPNFIKGNHLDFVFSDATAMIQKMYQKNDSPYLDYEGGFYYDYGDHFYQDGARSEGLIAAYYLAEKLKYNDLANKFLAACQKAALAQMFLFNCTKNNYAHLNQEKSLGSIRFKATRQYVRIDLISHVACFFFRLYFAEIGLKVK